jgi:hypothetical protein
MSSRLSYGYYQVEIVTRDAARRLHSEAEYTGDAEHAGATSLSRISKVSRQGALFTDALSSMRETGGEAPCDRIG